MFAIAYRFEHFDTAQIEQSFQPDPKQGVVELLVSPDFVEEMEQILEDLSRQIWMEALPGASYPTPFGK